jgi:hypothetical protein
MTCARRKLVAVLHMRSKNDDDDTWRHCGERDPSATEEKHAAREALPFRGA